jgi:hypothetical protein
MKKNGYGYGYSYDFPPPVYMKKNSFSKADSPPEV